MSTRTGIDQAIYFQYGGTSGSASSAQIDLALDIAWDWIETEIDTNIVNAFESQEIHLWPREARDWNDRNDRIQLNKTHLNTVSSVQMLWESDACNCELSVLSGCALIVNAENSMIAVRECSNAASAACASCGSLRGFQARVNYYAGVFLDANLDKNMILAVVLKAREVLNQILEGSLSGLGSVAVTQWRSMDYSETRAPPSKGESFIDAYIDKLLRDYKVKRAFSLRRTY